MRRFPVLAMALATVSGFVPARVPLVHEWQRVAGAGWQIAGEEGEDPRQTDAREGTRGECLDGMVAIAGSMRTGAVEQLQDAACLEWESGSQPRRCLRFDSDAWPALAASLPTRPMHFCIDRFEYPNRRGEHPVVATSWAEAGSLCGRQGKRLCTEDEWTFACEGPDALPYPYGFARDATACVIDRRNPAFDPIALEDRNDERFAAELDRLWRGEPSGSRSACRSTFGVYDLTGNVDEWTRSTSSQGRRSILKGGYWGPIRARCRPSTRAHGEEFVFYQIGFRCCA